ncbi:putative immunity protein [Tenggerimyces flavus]|uniref:Immunity protein n=1 Tax=Tenggerimyces flavus TaxID=1708749 RepID=A0ABV7YKT2_9ACTN|nr:exonuclease SbcC [Tenggerimyces flavus]MBM7787575.1 hypothetical protein [Tenggerimyces flavus]
MTDFELSQDELRAVTAFAAACAEDVLDVFAQAHPDDPRPREAIEAAWAFARGGKRTKAIRDAAWAAMRAASEADTEVAREAARAALAAAGAAYLHPLAKATQVKHLLGSAAYAARVAELTTGEARLERATQRATPTVVEVLERYPSAPPGGGRVGELIRELDATLRS